jgi:hypothetical protein
MGGRGTFAAGRNVAYQYETSATIEGVKVLRGLNGKHSLPEESHSSTAYIKLKSNQTFHEIRIYGKDHYLIMEIAYHPEPKLGKGNVLHYHTYDKNFKRSNAKPLTAELYQKYKKYFQGVE